MPKAAELKHKGPKIYKVKSKCAYCGGLPFYTNKKTSEKIKIKGMRRKHINVAQDPPITYFCSDECKTAWIRNKGKPKNKRSHP